MDVAQKFWEAVHARVDLSENRPGRLLCGYIRALTDDDSAVREILAPGSLLLILGSDQPVQKVLASDAQRWRQAFEGDGIEPALSQVIRSAAEGLAEDAGTPYLTPDELETARSRLLEMTETT